MLKMVKSLQASRYGKTYAELAQEFQVSSRTVVRDLQALDDVGVPVMRAPDEDGRTRVSVEGQASIELSLRERYTLLAARRLFDVFESTPLRQDMQNIFRRVAASLPKNQRADLEDIEDRVLFVPDNGRKVYDRHEAIIFDLMTAALQDTEVSFTYRSPSGGGTKQGILRPYALVLYRYGLYAVGERTYASDRSDARIRIYAIERFKQVELLRGQVFERPADFHIDRYFRGAFGLHAGDEEVEVRLRFTRKATPYVTSRTYQTGQKVEMQDDGGVILRFQATDLTEVVPFVLQWGREVQVDAPAELVEAVAEARGTAGRDRIAHEG